MSLEYEWLFSVNQRKPYRHQRHRTKETDRYSLFIDFITDIVGDKTLNKQRLLETPFLWPTNRLFHNSTCILIVQTGDVDPLLRFRTDLGWFSFSCSFIAVAHTQAKGTDDGQNAEQIKDSPPVTDLSLIHRFFAHHTTPVWTQPYENQSWSCSPWEQSSPNC